MREKEWLLCADPSRMVDWLSFRRKDYAQGDERNARKLRLFAVACCSGVWKWLLDERSRKAVTTAERHADGLVGEHELQVARKEAGEANDSLVGQPAYLSEAARAAFYTLIEPEFMWVGEVVLSAIRFSISDAVDGDRFSIEADKVDVPDF